MIRDAPAIRRGLARAGWRVRLGFAVGQRRERQRRLRRAADEYMPQPRLQIHHQAQQQRNQDQREMVDTSSPLSRPVTAATGTVKKAQKTAAIGQMFEASASGTMPHAVSTNPM